MSEPEQSRVAALSRRERQRQATFEEILQTYRRLLRAGGEPPTLRAIASEMGLTAPALYRYVDGHDALVGNAAGAILLELVGAIERAAVGQDPDDPAAQLIASVAAFRAWSLDNPREFAMLFASAESGKRLIPADGTFPQGRHFGRAFATLFCRVWQRYGFPVPAEQDLDPVLVQGLHEEQEALGECPIVQCPLGLTWVFVQAWARLYGTLTIEVFGHVPDGVVRSRALFFTMLDELGPMLGLTAELPRLRELARAVSAD